MNKNFIVLLTLALLGGATYAIFYHSSMDSSPEDLARHHQFVIEQAGLSIGFDLVDPNQAPRYIQEDVERGYRIVMNTPLYASNYVKNQLSCTNCHFSEGDTIGGKDNGISLVGVTAVYPKYSERIGKVISLTERVNLCFERSMNGLPLPEHAQEMQDILAYLKWISHEVSHLTTIPWLGLEPLKSSHRPNPVEGEKVYATYCALCHKEDGQGGAKLIESMPKQIPPLWGQETFNNAAGMSHLPTLAAFIYWNMPQNNSVLTEEQALDVAAFILEKPRPHLRTYLHKAS